MSRKAIALTIGGVIIGAAVLGTVIGGVDEEPSIEAVVTTTEAVSTTAATTTTEATTTTVAPTTTTKAATTTTTQATTTTEFVPSDEMLELMFVSVMRDSVTPDFPDLAYVDDDLIIEIGLEVCGILDGAVRDGDTPEETMLAFALTAMDGDDPEFSTLMIGTAIGAAPIAFCPEHENYAAEMIDYALNF